MEDEEESVKEEERDMRLAEEERPQRSAVVCTQAEYAFVDERRQRMDKVSSGDDQRARIKKVVPEVSTSASNQQYQSIRKAVAFGKQPANLDPIKIATPSTPKALKMPWNEALALDTGTYKVLASSQLDYTVVASQKTETGELTFRLLPNAKWYQFPGRHELLPGPWFHQEKLDLLTFLPSPAGNIMPSIPNSCTPGYLQLFSERYRGRNFACWSMVNQRSAWWVTRSLESWTSDWNMVTRRWSLTIAIDQIWRRWQSPTPSTSMVSSFTYLSFKPNSYPNRLLWVAPVKPTLESLRGTWTMVIVRSPAQPLIG